MGDTAPMIHSGPTQQLLHVLIVGAGFGGVGAAIQLRRHGIEDFLVVDKADGIGGTWWHNTYPGAACDIPSHLYCYSFEPNPDWSRKYSRQPEIQAYIARCARKYGVVDRIQLGMNLRELALEDGLWTARFSDGTVYRSRHVIFATGGLHMPLIPDIPGSGRFTGPAMHSAEWDASVDLRGKRVAVIGSAASAIQIVPEIAGVASRVDVYQRTPNYIAPRNDRAFSPWQKTLFARMPWVNRLYRHCIFLRGELTIFPVVKTRHPSRWRSFLERMLRRHIHTSIADAELAATMTPDYPLGCKRILIADNFYRALNRHDVSVISSGIERIDEHCVVTRDGLHHPADVLVYATGFDVENYLSSIDIRGADGQLLAARWNSGPEVYKGGFIPGLPNFYMTTGPHTGVGTTSMVLMIEAQLQLIMQAISAAGSDSLIEVQSSAATAYTREIREALKETVWAGSCKSWYKKDDGEIDTLYPHNARSYLRDHRQLLLEHFRLVPRDAA